MNEANPRPPNWTDRPLSVNKYVDDFLGCEKLSMYNRLYHFSATKPRVTIYKSNCQAFFNTVSENAFKIGMSVNANKTQMLCISTAHGRDVQSFITTTTEGGEIRTQDTLKILGFTFGRKPNANVHMEVIMTKF